MILQSVQTRRLSWPGDRRPARGAQAFQLIARRGALFRIFREGRAPLRHADAAQVFHHRVELKVERAEGRQMRRARRVSLAWSEAGGFKIHPQRPARRDEDIAHVLDGSRMQTRRER
jgi:hypothetical protein